MRAEDWIEFDEQAFDRFLAKEALERGAELEAISLTAFAPDGGANGLVDLIRAAHREGAIETLGQQQLEIEADGPDRVQVDLGAYGRYTRTIDQVFQNADGDKGPEALKAAAKYVSDLIGSGHADED